MFINLTQSEKEGIHHIVKELEKIRLKKEKRENTTDTRQVKGTAARYEINHSVLLKKENSEIQGRLWDISSKGCFITLSHAIQLDVMHEIEIQCMNISVKARGIAKWETNFINGKNALRDETYSKIASSERVLSSENDFSADKNFLDNSDRNKEFTDETPDNSASKEILSPENSAPKQGIRFHGVTSGEYGGYGFQFVGLSKPEQESIKAMIGALKKAGAKERLKQTSPLAYELIEQDLLNSPYKIVLFLKKSLFNRTK
jgi:hypothetical protein